MHRKKTLKAGEKKQPLKIKQIAGMSRIKLTPKEERQYQKQLEEFLPEFNEVKKISDKIQPSFQCIEIAPVLRQDVAETKSIKILPIGTRKENGYFKAPKVV